MNTARMRGINGTALDPRFGNPETIVYAIKVVDQSGHITNLKFPLFDKDKALTAAMSFINAPDMSFVSIGKEQG